MDEDGEGAGSGRLAETELASLVASRICHDLAGVVGAVVNGLELATDTATGDVDAAALDLVATSAALAGRRLAFARLAYGAHGGAQAVDAVEVERALEEHFAGGRIAVEVALDAPALERDAAKLVLNLATVAAGAIARGGILRVAGGAGPVRIGAVSDTARLPEATRLLREGAAAGPVEARSVDAYLCHRLAAGLGRTIAVEAVPGEVRFEA